MIKIDQDLQDKNGSSRKGSFVFWLLGFFALLAIDQISKYPAHNIFRNSAFAFSLPLPVWLMYSIYATVIIVMVYYVLNYYQAFSFTAKLGWTLIFAGAVSNIAERLFLGYVRDFIYISSGVFNLADAYIIFGILLLLLPSLKVKREEK